MIWLYSWCLFAVVGLILNLQTEWPCLSYHLSLHLPLLYYFSSLYCCQCYCPWHLLNLETCWRCEFSRRFRIRRDLFTTVKFKRLCCSSWWFVRVSVGFFGVRLFFIDRSSRWVRTTGSWSLLRGFLRFSWSTQYVWWIWFWGVKKKTWTCSWLTPWSRTPSCPWAWTPHWWLT